MEQDTTVLEGPETDTAAPKGADAFVPAGPRRRARWLTSVGIVATGLVAGAIGVATLQGSHSSAAATGAQGFAGPGGTGQGRPPGGGFRDRGGLGRPVQGTISAISATSITVGATTATINAATVILKDGAVSQASALATGDQVVVLTTTSGTSTVARQILAGTTLQGGFGGPPGQQPQDQPPAPTGSVSATT